MTDQFVGPIFPPKRGFVISWQDEEQNINSDEIRSNLGDPSGNLWGHQFHTMPTDLL